MMKKRAGHRCWAAGGKKVSGSHTGDIMSAKKRSEVMARIKGRNTGPELSLLSALISARVVDFECHAGDLPGRPDFVFRTERITVFVDGDFWHGFRFPLWEHKLSPKWQSKIAATRERDKRNFRRLRYAGWTVVRIWEHQIERDVAACAEKIVVLLEKRRRNT